MKQISVKGIVVGAIADIVATSLLAIPVVMIAAAKIDLLHVAKEQQTRVLLSAIHATPSLYIAQLLLGSFCSLLGGYLAARIARRSELLNGALSAFLCVGLGVYALATGRDTTGPWASALFFGLSPVLGAAGGYLYRRRSLSARRDVASA
jgi:hypothetical protein